MRTQFKVCSVRDWFLWEIFILQDFSLCVQHVWYTMLWADGTRFEISYKFKDPNVACNMVNRQRGLGSKFVRFEIFFLEKFHITKISLYGSIIIFFFFQDFNWINIKVLLCLSKFEHYLTELILMKTLPDSWNIISVLILQIKPAL